MSWRVLGQGALFVHCLWSYCTFCFQSTLPFHCVCVFFGIITVRNLQIETIFIYKTLMFAPRVVLLNSLLSWVMSRHWISVKSSDKKHTCWPVGLGVWFSLWVREVPGSNPGLAQLFCLELFNYLRRNWKKNVVVRFGWAQSISTFFDIYMVSNVFFFFCFQRGHQKVIFFVDWTQWKRRKLYFVRDNSGENFSLPT